MYAPAITHNKGVLDMFWAVFPSADSGDAALPLIEVFLKIVYLVDAMSKP